MGEYERLGKSGNRVFIQGSYSILRDSQGKPTGVVKLAADITVAKLAQEQLTQQTEELQAQEEEMRQNLEELTAMQEEMHQVIQESQRKEQFMRSLLNASTEAIFVLDRDMKLMDSNATFQVVLASQGQQLGRGEDVSQRWHEEERSHFQAQHARVFNGEMFETTEYLPILDGCYQLIYSPLIDEQKAIYASVVYVKDVKHLSKKTQPMR